MSEMEDSDAKRKFLCHVAERSCLAGKVSEARLVMFLGIVVFDKKKCHVATVPRAARALLAVGKPKLLLVPRKKSQTSPRACKEKKKIG